MKEKYRVHVWEAAKSHETVKKDVFASDGATETSLKVKRDYTLGKNRLEKRSS